MPKISFLSFSLCIAIVLVSQGVLAQVTPADRTRALDTLQRTQQKQENLIDFLRRESELNNLQKKQTTIEVTRPEKKEVKSGRCFEVETITLQNAHSLSQTQQNLLTAPHLNSCMDIAAINTLMRQVTNYYFDKGYVTTRVAIPQQNLNNGTLTLLVIEGKIETIKLNDNQFRDRLQVAMAFPMLKGKVLNLRDIEQGLDQLNRLSSSRATVKFTPGSKDGFSHVIVSNTPVKTTRARIGFDNSGQNSTGKRKSTWLIERDNALGLGEYINLSYNKDVADDSGYHGSEIISGQLSIPSGYWTLSGSLSRSTYRITTIGENQRFSTSGETGSGTVDVSRVLHRGQNSKTSATIGMTHKNTVAKLEENTELANTQALSIAKAKLDHTRRSWNAVWYGAVGYERGLDVFGARDDANGLRFDNPRAQFDKFTFSASFYKPFSLKNQNLAYRTLAAGQYSVDPLFSSEQLNIGDRYTVRGFQNESAIGDTGGYLRNELMWNVPQLSTNKTLNYVTNNLQPYAGIDVGWARIRGGKQADPSGEAYISGYAIGIRSNSDWLSADIAYSGQIKTPGTFAQDDDEIYFSLSTKIAF